MNFYKVINGKLVSGSGNKAPDDTWETDWSRLDSKEDGSYYTYYNDDFTVNVEKEAKAQAIIDAEAIKKDKQLELDTLVVEVNTVPFDGTIQSIGYMSSVLALANFKMIQAVSMGASMAEIYSSIYKTVIQWKNADNSISDVQLETVAEALEEAMKAISNIKTK